MAKLSKKRAAKLAGITVYRLNKDIESGKLKLTKAGAITKSAVMKCYSISEIEDEQIADTAIEATVAAVEDNQAVADMAALEMPSEDEAPQGLLRSEPDEQQMRLIGKLEALLSLAEKHRKVIEQQRRSIAVLNLLTKRQSEELATYRARTVESEQTTAQPWRRLLDKFSRAQNA